MRPIDADKLKRKVQRIATEAWMMKLNASVETTLNQFIDYVDEAPTVEPKRGEWVENGDLDGGYWHCSVCKTPTEAYAAFTIYAYCPFCGARMEDVKHLPHIKRLKGADDE